jgi:hypothetical protein
MTTTHCGDSCGLIDFTMAVAGDRLLPKERMKLAIEAVTSGKMSQGKAAEKYEVTQQGISKALKRVTTGCDHTKPQSTTEVSPAPTSTATTKTPRFSQVRSGLRALLKKHGAPAGVAGGSNFSPPAARGWLEFAGVQIPPELQGRSTPFNPSNESHDPPATERLSANDHVPAQQCDRPGEVDPDEDDDATLDDRIDLDKLSAQVLREVQRSNQSESFKRVVELLTEAEKLIVLAYYGKDEWSGQNWVHVNSQVKACKSLAGQRAEEAHRQVFSARNAESCAVAV